MEQIVADYQREYDVAVTVQYGGSNTLLSQIEVGRTGDLFLAADDSYMDVARDKGLIAEVMPLATMRPVVVIRKDAPHKFTSLVAARAARCACGLRQPGCGRDRQGHADFARAVWALGVAAAGRSTIRACSSRRSTR